MQLIQARIINQPQNVETKRGGRSTATCLTADGRRLVIWRPEGDPELLRLANGERVQITVSSGGTVSLVETSLSRAEAGSIAPIIPTIPAVPSRAVEIADYVERLGKLYKHCYTATSDQLKGTPLTVTEIKDVAMAIFHQSIDKFNL